MGGHGKVVANTLDLLNKHVVFWNDDHQPATNEDEMIVAIGNSEARERIYTGFHESKKFPTVIHPSAVISASASIGEGTWIGANVTIGPDTNIGKCCIINNNSNVDHDCVVGDFSTVSPCACICGNVTIGNHVWVGASACIREKLSVCDNVMIGIGAAVVKSIQNEGTWIGVPAKQSFL